jgi:hypothetical protein
MQYTKICRWKQLTALFVLIILTSSLPGTHGIDRAASPARPVVAYQTLRSLVTGPSITCPTPSPSPTPTPLPTPAFTNVNNEIVTRPSNPSLTGMPGDRVTFRRSLTNTTPSSIYYGEGYAVYDCGGYCYEGGNAPQVLGDINVEPKTDPLAGYESTGDVPIVSFQINSNNAGPFPRQFKILFFTASQQTGYDSGFATFTLRIDPRPDLSRPPLLLTEGCEAEAVALNSVTLTRGPFALSDRLNFSADHRTRIALFAWNMNLQPGEDGSAVTVEAVDSQLIVHPLAVEFVGVVPGTSDLTEIVVRLADDLRGPDKLLLHLIVHGRARFDAAYIHLKAPAGGSP